MAQKPIENMVHLYPISMQNGRSVSFASSIKH